MGQEFHLNEYNSKIDEKFSEVIGNEAILSIKANCLNQFYIMYKEFVEKLFVKISVSQPPESEESNFKQLQNLALNILIHPSICASLSK